MTSRRLLVPCACLALLAAVAGVDAHSAEPIVTTLTIFAGTRQGLWRSQDWGATWQQHRQAPDAVVPDGPSEKRAVHCVLPMGPRVYAGTDAGLFVSEDFGVTWPLRLLEGTPILSVVASRYFDSEPVVIVGTPAGLLKSSDGGKTFRPTALAGTPVTRIAWPGPALVLATGSGVRVSPDGGESFIAPSAGLPAGEARAVVASSFFSQDPVAFAAVGSAGVFRTADGGGNWVSAGLAGRRVTDLYWLGPILFAASDGGLFRSTDLGREWLPSGEGLTATPLRLLFPLAPDSGAEVFAGSDKGVFRSGDGAERWQASGLEDQEVLVVATFPPMERPSSPQRRRR
jgi:photosystem II stability/assembly factor-like uncharacterized protein